MVGSLIEKALATPHAYPLTVNALRVACNQATNRDPVVAYDERAVEMALASLRTAGLIRIVYSSSNRAPKYRHVLDEALGLDDAGLALLAVLLLRGAQTVGELKARSERLHRFADLAEVEATLQRLAGAAAPAVRRLERRPGQKDLRWVHRLGSADPQAGSATDEGPVAAPAPDATGPAVVGQERLVVLEETVAGLVAEVGALRRRVDDMADIAGPASDEI